MSNRHARTPALRKASSVLQIRCGNFQNGLFRPLPTCSTSCHFKFKQLRALCPNVYPFIILVDCSAYLTSLSGVRRGFMPPQLKNILVELHPFKGVTIHTKMIILGYIFPKTVHIFTSLYFYIVIMEIRKDIE